MYLYLFKHTVYILLCWTPFAQYFMTFIHVAACTYRSFIFILHSIPLYKSMTFFKSILFGEPLNQGCHVCLVHIFRGTCVCISVEKNFWSQGISIFNLSRICHNFCFPQNGYTLPPQVCETSHGFKSPSVFTPVKPF